MAATADMLYDMMGTSSSASRPGEPTGPLACVASTDGDGVDFRQSCLDEMPRAALVPGLIQVPVRRGEDGPIIVGVEAMGVDVAIEPFRKPGLALAERSRGVEWPPVDRCSAT